jgi:exosortase
VQFCFFRRASSSEEKRPKRAIPERLLKAQRRHPAGSPERRETGSVILQFAIRKSPARHWPFVIRDRVSAELLQRVLLLALFGAIWSVLIKHLSEHWAVNPQYSFGWFVPLLSAYLFLIRWRTRPPVQRADSAAAGYLFWIAGFALLPTWLIEQVDPDWRLISWLLTSEVVALSLCAIYFIGGSRWVRHFAFSICLIFASVPWQVDLENFFIQGLTRVATVITVASLNLFHISAVQHGNVIEVNTGLLGIDGACSGIRSLQATLMVSLFFGELYYASRLRRVMLVLGGALMAFLCNLGRTFLLAAIATKDGIQAVENWHDPLGIAILAICLLLVWALAHLVAGPLPKLPTSKNSGHLSFPWPMAVGLSAWVLFTLAGVEVWYRVHETKDTHRLSIAWPVYKRDFTNVSIPKFEADALACDEGRVAEWTNDDGSRWMMFLLTWAEGPARSKILARLHRPEICLPAAGYQLRQDRGTITVKAKDLVIPFHALDFEYAGDPVYVFDCVWENRSIQSARPRIREKWTRSANLESVLLGERNLGQQVLEIVIFGYRKPEEAEAALSRDIESMIQT